jgi:hypothetical protein
MMTTTAATNVMAIPMTVSAMSKNNRVVGIAEQGISCRARHRRGSKCRHRGQCTGGKADQQKALHLILPKAGSVDNGSNSKEFRVLKTSFSIRA